MTDPWTTEHWLRLLISEAAADLSEAAADLVPTVPHQHSNVGTGLLSAAFNAHQRARHLLALVVAHNRAQGARWADIASLTGGGTASAAQQRHTRGAAVALATAAAAADEPDRRTPALATLDEWLAERGATGSSVSSGLPPLDEKHAPAEKKPSEPAPPTATTDNAAPPTAEHEKVEKWVEQESHADAWFEWLGRRQTVVRTSLDEPKPGQWHAIAWVKKTKESLPKKLKS